MSHSSGPLVGPGTGSWPDATVLQTPSGFKREQAEAFYGDKSICDVLDTAS